MAVETINQPMSDFAIKLANALKSIGHHYFGKIDYDKINVEEYLKLSPREMALRYAKEHDLAIKKTFMDILKHIHKENKADNFRVPLRQFLDDKQLDYVLATSAINRSGLIKKKGERTQTEYTWLKKDAPVFSDAEFIYDIYKRMREYKMPSKAVDYIEDHMNDSLEDLQKHLNPEDNDEKYYQIRRLHAYKRTQANAREKRVKELLSANKILEREVSRKPPKTYNNEQPSPSLTEETPVVQNLAETPVGQEENKGTDIPAQSSMQKDQAFSLLGLNENEKEQESLLYLMAQRVKMYKKICKIQEKMLRKYEQKLKS